MSTVPEVLAAREEGLNVVVLSLVTNFVVIPETYRSIKEEVQAEVSNLVWAPYMVLILFHFWFSLLERKSSCQRLRLSHMKKFWRSVRKRRVF